MRVCLFAVPVLEKSQIVLSYTDTFTTSDDELPQHSQAITDEKGLIDFFSSEKIYAHLAADIELHRDYGGYDMAAGKTLDGRGYSVKLSDEYANATVYEIIEGEYYFFSSEEVRDEDRYGLFVNVNDGEIKNIRFEFSTSVIMVNDGNAREIALGLVCGENNGTIHNCDLMVSGSFEYYYQSEDFYESEIFKTDYGGFAGINNGLVTNVGAKYEDFTLALYTIAGSGAEIGAAEIPAQVLVGGIVGEMSAAASCDNVKISGRSVKYKLAGVGYNTDEVLTYAGAAAAIGWLDNVVVDFDVEYVYALTGTDRISKNAVVHIGQAVNVTALNAYDGAQDLRSNNMSGQDDVEYCNYINSDSNAQVQVNIYNDDQIIDIRPRQGAGELSFIKYKEENGEIAEDCEEYVNVPQNFTSQVINGDIGIRVAAYQRVGKDYWELIVETAQEEPQPPKEPTLEVIALLENFEYLSDTIAKSDVTFIAQAYDGFAEYRIDGGEWRAYDGELIVTESLHIEFRAVSIDGSLESDIIYYNVIISREPEPVTVRADWFIVTASKVYDGGDSVAGIDLDIEHLEAFQVFMKIKDCIRFSAKYSKVDVGAADIIIEVWLEGTDEYVLENSVVTIVGYIAAKEIEVTLEKSYATYGLGRWEFNYSVSGLIADDEVTLQFKTDADASSLPSDTYRFWLAQREYGNYAVANFDELNSYEYGAPLEIEKFEVKEIIFDVQTASGLDVIVGFVAADGSDVVHLLDVTYELIVDGIATAKELIDEVGLYRITVALPQNLSDRYALSQEIEPILVQIDQLFDEDEPSEDEPPTDEEEEEPPKEDNGEESGDTVEDEAADDLKNATPQPSEIGVKAKSIVKAVLIIAVVAGVSIGVGLFVKNSKTHSAPKKK